MRKLLIMPFAVYVSLSALIWAVPERIFPIHYAHWHFLHRFISKRVHPDAAPEILLIGDSTMSYGLRAAAMPRAVNFGSGGISSLEMHSILKMYLNSRRQKPKVVLFNIPVFQSLYRGRFWNYAKFGTFSLIDLAGIAYQSARLGSYPTSDVTGAEFAARSLLIWLRSPFMSAADLKTALVADRRSSFDARFDLLLANQGSLHFEELAALRRSRESAGVAVDPQELAEATDQQETAGDDIRTWIKGGYRWDAVFVHYLREFMELGRSRGIVMVCLQMPVDEQVLEDWGRDYFVSAFHKHEKWVTELGGLYWKLERNFPRQAFLDGRHLNMKGSEVLTRIVTEKLRAVVLR